MYTNSLEPLEARIAPATFTVTSLLDTDVEGTLRHAIKLANDQIMHPGLDTIVIKVAGTIKIAAADGPLPDITDDLKIVGKGMGKTIISGEDSNRVFTISETSANATAGNGTDVTISKLTVTKGSAAVGGGILVNTRFGHVLLDSIEITGNKAVGATGVNASGGGLNVEAGSVILQKSKVTGNSAKGAPGADGEAGLDGQAAFYIPYDPATYFGGFGGDASSGGTGYSGEQGGSAYGGGIYNTGTLQIKSCTISGNTAVAGIGGKGGTGGVGGDSSLYDTYGYQAGAGGLGGLGGQGGTAAGGGVNNGGTMVITKSTITGNNSVTGGVGGVGGAGGAAGTSTQANPAQSGLGGAGGTGGNSGGGGVEGYFGTLSIQSSTVSMNLAKGGVGGVGGADAGVTTPSSGVAGEVGRGYGGGLDLFGAAVVNSSKILNNTAEVGGGISSSADLGPTGFDGHQVLLTKVTISGNKATVDGGGLSGGGVSVTGSLITTNTAAHNGGGVLATGTVEIHASTISANTAISIGGGVHADGGGATLVSTKVTGNTAGVGGGASLAYQPGTYNPVYQYTSPGSGSLTLQQSTISGNHAIGVAAVAATGGNPAIPRVPGNGGGIFVDGGGAGGNKGYGLYQIHLFQSTIDSNTATDSGGGIAGIGGAGVAINSSTISRNTAIDGAGIHLSSASALASDATIAMNTATGSGGAVDLILASLNAFNSTIAFNKAGTSATASGGGVSADANSGINLISTLIAKNTGTLGADVYVATGGQIDASSSLIQAIAYQATTPPTTPAALRAGNFVGAAATDPIFSGGLKKHGGFTETILLSKKSVAVDHGQSVDLLVDQIGKSRLLGFATDIGAVEVA